MATAAAVIGLYPIIGLGDASIAGAIASVDATLGTIYAAYSAEEIASAAIIAGLNFYIQDAYLQLAEDYYNLYNNQRQFYYTNFQNNANGELGLLTQTFAIPLYTPQYAMQSSVIQTYDDFTSGFPDGNWWINRAHMYNDTPLVFGGDGFGNINAENGELDLLEQQANVTDSTNYLYRYEDHRKDVYDERRWEWQNQALNFGVKQASVVQSGLATSFGFLDTAMGGMADFFATQANGIAEFAGYRNSVASNGAKLAAASQRGRGLAFSPNLGVDINARSYGTDQNQYQFDPHKDLLPSMFESVQ